MNRRAGNGWAMVTFTAEADVPGEHDVSRELGLPEGTATLLVLLAAHRHAVQVGERDELVVIACQAGRVAIELEGGGHRTLERSEVWSAREPVRGVVNVGTNSARALLVRA